ncbi:MAG: type II toxin-antitoxin system RelE/ParE family toxin [Bryobacteraceae bacterium]|jgi:mRNA-degrading endonuclease RelE of RelBE toxin-antitoxin system
MSWTVSLAREAVKQLKAIPPDRRERILDDLRAMAEDPFRGLVKPLKGKEFKGRYRKVSGRYRIIFRPDHANRTAEVLLILLRNERTYKV